MGPKRSTGWVLVLASVLCLAGASDDSTPRRLQPVAGIEVFDLDYGPAEVAIQEVTMALSAAVILSNRYPDRFAFAYREGAGVVLNAIDPLAGKAAVSVETVRRKHPLVPIRIRYVDHSQAVLLTMINELVGEQPEGQFVRRAGPDARLNKVVLSVNDINEAFARRIARTYPTSAMAFELTDMGPMGY